MNSAWLLASRSAARLVALWLLLRAMLRMLRQARLCTPPLPERQELAFPAGGLAVLCMQHPRFSRPRYALRLPGGAEVPGRPMLFRLALIRPVTSGLSHALVTLLVQPRRGEDAPVTRHHAGPDAPVVRGLRLSPTRVGGQVERPADADLKCSVRFSAPAFNE